MSAPAWMCAACGKTAPTREQLQDASCYLNARPITQYTPEEYWAQETKRAKEGT